MSLITRCPACETMFKVVPDQLRISDGWVRCGQCGEIFDASQHLLADPHLPRKTVVNAPVEAPVDIVAPAAPAAPVVSVTSVTSAELADPSVEQPVPEPALDFTLELPGNEPPWAETVVPEQPVIDHAPALPNEEPPLEPIPIIAPSPVVDPVQEVSFMQVGKVKTIWQRRGIRIVMLLAAALLLIALVVQILIHERDRIAAAAPAVRPVLQALCNWNQCSLSPLRQIESIVIESSSFTLTRGDIYKLAFSLKNNALVDLAMPAIELALTDAQDQPLIRRVILPVEFGAPSNPLTAGSAWSSSMSLSVKATANMDRIAGYRMLAFYP